MTTELDELAALAVNDPSLSRVGLDRLIRSVIDRTRRDWATMSDEHLALDAVIGVGLGYAALTRDGWSVYDENGKRHCDLMTVAQAEDLARREPERDWRIHLVSQLENRHYRREGACLWVLYERGHGMS
jgi:hypothetical protein